MVLYISIDLYIIKFLEIINYFRSFQKLGVTKLYNSIYLVVVVVVLRYIIK